MISKVPRLLIVNSDLDTADQFSVDLRSNGFENVVATCEHSALGAVVEFDPAATFVYLGLPLIPNICGQIRARSSCKIIAMTGYCIHNHNLEEFDHHLDQPSIEEVLRLLSIIL